MKEKDLQVIELQGLSAKTMEILLDCIYSEKVGHFKHLLINLTNKF
jgi:hypothetical protein